MKKGWTIFFFLMILLLLAIIWFLWHRLHDCENGGVHAGPPSKTARIDSVLYTTPDNVHFTIIHKTKLVCYSRPDTAHPYHIDSFPLNTGVGMYFKTINKDKYLFFNDPIIPNTDNYTIIGEDLKLFAQLGSNGDVSVTPLLSAPAGVTATMVPGPAIQMHGGAPYLRVRGMGNSGGNLTGADTPDGYLYMDVPIPQDDGSQPLIFEMDATHPNLLLIGFPNSLPNIHAPYNNGKPFYYMWQPPTAS